jgi:hypothetical protein
MWEVRCTRSPLCQTLQLFEPCQFVTCCLSLLTRTNHVQLVCTLLHSPRQLATAPCLHSPRQLATALCGVDCSRNLASPPIALPLLPSPCLGARRAPLCSIHTSFVRTATCCSFHRRGFASRARRRFQKQSHKQSGKNLQSQREFRSASDREWCLMKTRTSTSWLFLFCSMAPVCACLFDCVLACLIACLLLRACVYARVRTVRHKCEWTVRCSISCLSVSGA